MSLQSTIQSLLNKTIANGCTEAEAIAALAKAHDLMDRYNITEREIATQSAPEHAIVISYKPTTDQYQIVRVLRRTLDRFCGVQSYIEAFTNRRRTAVREYRIVGLRADVELWQYLSQSLKQFVESTLLAALLDDPTLDAAAFCQGGAKRITEQLHKILQSREASRTAQSNALVVTKRAAIDDKLRSMGVTLFKTKGPALNTSSASYNSGYNAATGASYGRPVSHTLRLTSH